MGIGFGASARTPLRNNKPLSRADTFAAVRKAVESACEDPFLAKFIEFGENEHDLAVVLYPGAEAVFFTWNPGGTITADAKTSTAGPGYHAYAVGVVREVGQQCGLAWEWEDEGEYAPEGDFETLKEHMRVFLRAMANSFLRDSGPETTLAVNMSTGAPVPAAGNLFTITPMGPRDQKWWKAIQRGDNTEAAAREFFPWWERDRDAAFYRNTGLLLLWCEITWRPPSNEVEENVMNLALECFERAAELDPGMKLPERELEEIRVLLGLDEGEDVPEPRPGLIGYYRAVINRPLPGHWTVQLPGFWQESFDEETGCLTIYHNERAVHITTYGFEPEPGHPPPDPEQIAGFPDDIPEGATKVEFRDNGHVRRAIVTRTKEDDAEGIILQGCVGAGMSVAEVTIWFEDENDREWAEVVFRSLKAPSEDQD
jgi:hypothetical protein